MKEAIIYVQRGFGKIPALWNDEGELVGVLMNKKPMELFNAVYYIESLLSKHHGEPVIMDANINTHFIYGEDETIFLTYSEGEITREAQLTWTLG
jgi:hypothetical protein